VTRYRSALMSTLVILAVTPVGAPALASPSHATPNRATQAYVVSGPGAAARVVAAGGHVQHLLPLIHGVIARLPVGTSLPGLLVTPASRPLHATSDRSRNPGTAAYSAADLLSPPADGGQGVTVAIVDTGIADVPVLAGWVEHLDGQAYDGYGHGTFMAGLVHDVAPAAQLLDVRVADAAGNSSLGQVLQGLQSVDDVAAAKNVRVLNLSLSSGSPLPPSVDPLAQALEALQAHGVTVVVPSGNDPQQITSPGDDPALITVGALDSGTGRMAPWSGSGPTEWGEQALDLLAPGVHLLGPAAPGSVIVTDHPEAVQPDGQLRGSGTSMATAITSGAVATVLSARPELTPGGVQSLLRSTADPLGRHGSTSTLNLGAALSTASPADVALPVSTFQLPEGASKDWTQWDGRSWAARSWAGRSWAARSWSARSWSARSWVARSWSSRSWASDTWS
jgi:serine protease AprX